MEGFAFKRDAGLSWAQSGVTVRGSIDSVDPIEFETRSSLPIMTHTPCMQTYIHNTKHVLI